MGSGMEKRFFVLGERVRGRKLMGGARPPARPLTV